MSCMFKLNKYYQLVIVHTVQNAVEKELFNRVKTVLKSADLSIISLN